MERKVTAIPAIKQRRGEIKVKKRVAGYARVSTDMEEQATSYEAQVQYYTNYISGHDDWVFVGMYSDEGISGTNTKNRDGFNQMVDDALNGKIDLIITKSVSRFARNTVDSLTTVRKFKEKGVEIYFEKENIWTLDSKGELLITIMSSLAQEESRSISENVKWGHRKRFADGKGSLAFTRFLGYDKDFKINEEEAHTVRLIYKMYLSGMSCNNIVGKLTDMGKKTPCGKGKWHVSTITSILKNEKYKGDALLQKSYTVDFLTKKKAKNSGEVPQYYVENHHEAIIDPETFRLVQNELERRKNFKKTGIFTAKLICGDCGGFYGRKIWHCNDSYRNVVWQCNDKYKAKEKCATPYIKEDDIKEAFMTALSRHTKDDLIQNAKTLKGMVMNTSVQQRKYDKLTSELEELYERRERLIYINTSTGRSQDDYEKEYNELVSLYDEKCTKRETVKQEIEDAQNKAARIDKLIKVLKEHAGKFDEELWSGLVEKATLYRDGRIEFTLHDGSII